VVCDDAPVSVLEYHPLPSPMPRRRRRLRQERHLPHSPMVVRSSPPFESQDEEGCEEQDGSKDERNLAASIKNDYALLVPGLQLRAAKVLNG